MEVIRSLIQLSFFLGILSVHIYEANSKKQLPESPSGEFNSALSCVLFGDKGCNASCVLKYALYGKQAHGHCFGKQNCSCQLDYPHTTLYVEWTTKFYPGYAYNQIVNDPLTLGQVIPIMIEPLKTADETKQSLRPILSPHQFSQLETNDRTPAAQFFKDGKLDKPAILELISSELDSKFKIPGEGDFLYLNYQNRFRQTLAVVRDAGTLYNFTHKVTQLGNKSLETVLDEYLKENNIEKPAVDLNYEPQADEFLCNLIINVFIKRSDTEKNSPRSPSAFPGFTNPSTSFRRVPSTSSFTRRYPSFGRY